MDIERAAALSEEFLRKYVLDHDFFTPADELAEMREDPDDDESGLYFVFLRAFPDPKAADQIVYEFCHGTTVNRHDPVTGERVKQSLDELAAAHPELSAFKRRVLVSSPDGSIAELAGA